MNEKLVILLMVAIVAAGIGAGIWFFWFGPAKDSLLARVIVKPAGENLKQGEDSGVGICGNGNCENVESADNCPQDCESAAGSSAVGTKLNQCRTDGQMVRLDNSEKCCLGLSAIKMSQLMQAYWPAELANGEADDLVGCSNCGDGICGGWETSDNCAQDCKSKSVCASYGETIYSSSDIGSDKSAPTKCCNEDAGVKIVFPKADKVAMINRGVCVKDWDKNCGNKICDPGEDPQNCPWDCIDIAAFQGSSCSDMCKTSNPDWYSSGYCVTPQSSYVNSADEWCASSESGLAIVMGMGNGPKDCSLYSQSKKVRKACCCKHELTASSPNPALRCIEEGGFALPPSGIAMSRQECCQELQFVTIATTLYGAPQDICVKQGKTPDDLVCKTDSDIQGWYYKDTGKLIFESVCPEKTVCVIKNNACDWGSGSMTKDCRDEGGGAFVIQFCNERCEPVGRCVK